MIELFDKGGAVMWVLALLSVYTLGIVVFKLWQFASENVFSARFVDRALVDIKHGNHKQAAKGLENTPGPLAKVMRTGLACVGDKTMSEKHKEAEIMRVGSADLHHLESHMRGLEIAAAIAPLLGLLGTVIGLIDSFSRLGIGSSRVDPTMLAGGIWEALLTTATGLAIAIPALVAYTILDSWLEKLRLNMKDVSIQILALADAASEPASDAPVTPSRAA